MTSNTNNVKANLTCWHHEITPSTPLDFNGNGGLSFEGTAEIIKSAWNKLSGYWNGEFKISSLFTQQQLDANDPENFLSLKQWNEMNEDHLPLSSDENSTISDIFYNDGILQVILNFPQSKKNVNMVFVKKNDSYFTYIEDNDRFISINDADYDLVNAFLKLVFGHLTNLSDTEVHGHLIEELREHLEVANTQLYLRNKEMLRQKNSENKIIKDTTPEQKERLKAYEKSKTEKKWIDYPLQIGNQQVIIYSDIPIEPETIASLNNTLEKIQPAIASSCQVLNKPFYIHVFDKLLAETTMKGVTARADPYGDRPAIDIQADDVEESTLAGLILHETGHLIHFEVINNDSIYTRVMMNFRSNEEKLTLDNKYAFVSSYAATNAAEYFAECFYAFFNESDQFDGDDKLIFGKRTKKELKEKDPKMYWLMWMMFDPNSRYSKDLSSISSMDIFKLYLEKTT